MITNQSNIISDSTHICKMGKCPFSKGNVLIKLYRYHNPIRCPIVFCGSNPDLYLFSTSYRRAMNYHKRPFKREHGAFLTKRGKPDVVFTAPLSLLQNIRGQGKSLTGHLYIFNCDDRLISTSKEVMAVIVDRCDDGINANLFGYITTTGEIYRGGAAPDPNDTDTDDEDDLVFNFIFGSRKVTVPAAVPAAAVEVPAAAVEVPVAAVEVPAAAVEVPVAAVEVPAAAVEVPAAAVEVPVAAVEVPVAAVEVPVAAVEVPAAAVEVPVAAVEVPAAAVEVPADMDEPDEVVFKPKLGSV